MSQKMGVQMNSKREKPTEMGWLRLILIVLCASSMGACSTIRSSLQPSPVSAVTSTDAGSRAARFQHALDLLQNGDAHGADAELHAYLKDVPDSKAAVFLIAQIEKPLSELFPSDSFTIKLSRNDSLSSLAKMYLGDSLSFYGLARYNDIPVPGKVSEGQNIRIPKTAESMQALARSIAAAAAPQTPAPAASTPSKSTKPPEPSRKLADVYYERGLVAFQHQDLNTAIADWDKVLAIDPNHKDAQLSRAQAVRLKNNLAKLKK
jgi:Tfp pilus assembly protein PilF